MAEDKITEQKIILETKQQAIDEWPDISVIKDWTVNDPLRLSAKDPEFEYRWLRDDHKNISIKTSNYIGGLWRIVPKEHIDALEKRFNIKLYRAPDGLIRYGDLILGYIPKKIYEQKQKIKAERTRKPIEDVDKTLKEGIDLKELQGIHPTLKGIQTKEQLGMK
ncbi:MAG: hypothetical protein FJ150_02740 [Euryarchaeota archaeon]|nr:hypothetical protein [Euryarchaeota archaeon]